MCLPFSSAGVDEYGPIIYPGPPRGPDEVATRLKRLDPCGIERSFSASTGHAHWAQDQPATVWLLHGESLGVQAAPRTD